MEYDITARHFDLSQDLETKIEKSMSKLDRYSDRIISAHIFLELNGSHYNAELQLKTRSSLFNAKETSYDLYSSVDKIVKRVERQLKRHIDRLQSKKSREERGRTPYG